MASPPHSSGALLLPLSPTQPGAEPVPCSPTTVPPRQAPAPHLFAPAQPPKRRSASTASISTTPTSHTSFLSEKSLVLPPNDSDLCMSPGQIHLRGRTIQVVAAAYARATSVTQLVIPETASQVAAFLESIPLHTLEALDVSYCRLGSLPLGLGASLHTLNVDGNPLGDPPSWLCGLTGLRTLVWSRTGARCVPDLSALTQLTTLSLEGNELIEPPRWAHRLVNLRDLRLGANPLLDQWKTLIRHSPPDPPRPHRPPGLSSGIPLPSPRSKSPLSARSPRWGKRAVTSGATESRALSPSRPRRSWTPSTWMRPSRHASRSEDASVLDRDLLSAPQSPPHCQDTPSFDAGGLALALESLSTSSLPSSSSPLTPSRLLRPPILQYLRDLEELCSPLPPLPDTVEEGVAMTGLGPAMVSQHSAGWGRLEYLQRRAREDPTRRQHILAELIESEQRYVRGLETLVEVYIFPLRGIVPSAQERAVFGNVESLLAFHRIFFPALRVAHTAEQVFQTFLSHMAFFRLYMIYISTREEAGRILERWKKPVKRKSLPKEEAMTPDLAPAQRKAVHGVLHMAASDPRTSSLGLGSYLLLPVQRIPQYRLFLEDLVRCSPSTRTAGEALTQLMQMAGGINEAQRRTEMVRRLASWNEKLTGLDLSAVPHRRLLREGDFVLHRIIRLGQTYLPTQPALGESEMQKIDVLYLERPHSNVTVLLCTDVVILVLPFSEDKSLTAQLDLCEAQVDGTCLRLRGDKTVYYLSPQHDEHDEQAEDWAREISGAYWALKR